MKDFLIGIRKLEKVTRRNVLSKAAEQRAIEPREEYKVVSYIGDKHHHKCTKCRTKYSCRRGEGCSDVRSGVCDKCIKEESC